MEREVSPTVMNLARTWNLLVDKILGWVRDCILLLPNLAVAVLILVAFWLLARLARGVLRRLMDRVSRSEQVSLLLGQTVYVALVAAGLFISLGILGLQKTVASLLAGAGILGLALGFAFQDMAANLIAGIYLSLQHPFRVGHLIASKDALGVVRRIQLRWTEIRTQQGQVLLIPNKQVIENPITNYSTTGQRRVDLAVGVSYGEDLTKVRRVAVQAVEQVAARKADRPVELFFEEFGESSVNLVVRFWIDFAARQADYLQARSEAIERLKKAFDENDVTIPFPIRTLDFGGRDGERLSEALKKVAAEQPDLQR